MNIYLNSNNLADICLTILIACISVHVGFLAFVYPQIFQTTRKLKEISEIYIDKLEKNIFIHYYFRFVSFFLFLSILSTIIFLLDEDNLLGNYRYCEIAIVLNVILSFCSILISGFIYKRLYLYYNRPDQDFRTKKLILKNNDAQETLNLLQVLVINNFSNRHDASRINCYLEIIKEIFFNNQRIKNQEKRPSVTILNNYYNENHHWYMPLHTLQYLNQQATFYKNEYVSNELIDTTIDILDIYLKDFPQSDMYMTELEIVDTIKHMILYKIKNNFYNSELDGEAIVQLFCILEKYKNNHQPQFINENQLNPNENIFYIFSKMINNQEIGFDNYKYILQRFSDLSNPRNNYQKALQRFNCNVISYMLYKNKYDLAYNYMFYEMPKNNETHYIFAQFPQNISDIFLCFVENKTTFKENKKFEKNEISKEYKYFVMFLLICNVKDRVSKLEIQRNKLSNNKYLEEQIKNYQEINKTLIDKMQDTELFYNYINDEGEIHKSLETFFGNSCLMEEFGYSIDYKDYIISIISKIRKMIKKRRDYLLNAPLDNIHKNDLIEMVDQLFENNDSDSILDSYQKQKLTKWENTWKYFKPKKTFRFYSKVPNVVVKYEKGRLLASDYSISSLFRQLGHNNEDLIFSSIKKHTLKINNVKDLDNINLSNYSIISNFGDWYKTFEEVFDKKNIVYHKQLKESVVAIKINNKEIPIIPKITRFHRNSKKKVILIINKEYISITKNKCTVKDIKETKLDQKDIFDDFFNSQYKTNTKVVIETSPLFQISYAERFVGYFININ